MFRIIKIVIIISAITSTAFAKGTIFEKGEDDFLTSDIGYQALVSQFALLFAYEIKCNSKVTKSAHIEFAKFKELTELDFIYDVDEEKYTILYKMRKNRISFCSNWGIIFRDKGLVK